MSPQIHATEPLVTGKEATSFPPVYMPTRQPTMDLGPNKKRFNKNVYQSGDQNAYQGSNYLLVSRVPIKEGTSTSISKYSQTPECH